MLAFSDNFNTQIENKDAIHRWGVTGWLGKQHNLFKNTSGCDHVYDYWYGYTLCVLDENANSIRNWRSLVEDIVYKDYSLGENTLSGTRQNRAVDKTLLVAGSMLTSNALLNEYGEGFTGDRDKYQYYMACQSPATPSLGSLRFAASCDNDERRFQEVTPVIFSGLPSGSNDKVPPFLPALGQTILFMWRIQR